MFKRVSSTPYLLWSILFIIVPLLLVVYYAVTVSDAGTTGFSLENFKRFADPIFISVTVRSIYVALVSTAICLLLGYPLAYFMTRVKPSYEKLLVILLVLPMWMNFLLRTYAWQSLLGRNGLIASILDFVGFGSVELLFNEGTVLLGMVYNFLPFMVLPIYTVLKKIDPRVVEAAEDLGANRYIVFKRVILPLSVPGIVSGITMTFMPAVSTFVISALLGGGKYTLIGNLIEQQFLLVGNWNFGSALSVILMTIVLAASGILYRYDKQEERVSV
ncbi:MAG: ABC transporter permease [Bacillota bacterium]